MSPALRRGLERAVPVLACGVVLWLHVQVWALRAPYPFDLEWMEGGMLAHAWRLQQGLPLYVRPGPEFVPYLYPPGYPALLAALGGVFGLSPLLGRAVSVAGILAAAAGAGFLTARASGSWRAAAFAATALVGTYHHTGAFYDLVRPDSLFLALLAWSIALAFERGAGPSVSAGLLLAAAFTVKHNAAAWGPPLAAVVWWRYGGRRALLFALAAAVPAGLLALRWQLASDGLFATYLLEVPARHPSLLERLWPGLPQDVGNPLFVPLSVLAGFVLLRAAAQPLPAAVATGAPVLAGMLVGWAGTYVRPPPESGLLNVPSAFAFFALGAVPLALVAWVWGGHRRDTALFEPLVLGGATLAVAAAMRAHNGGYVNVLAPLSWVIAVGAAVVLGRWVRSGGGALAGAVMVAHLAWVAGTFERGALLPTRRDREAGERFVEACRTVEGPVLSPFAAWLPTYAGKPPSLHYMGVWDLEYEGIALRGDTETIARAVSAHHWALVLGGNQRFGYGLQEAYPREEVLLQPKNRSLMPKTGWPARPIRLLRPGR